MRIKAFVGDESRPDNAADEPQSWSGIVSSNLSNTKKDGGLGELPS